ncbi:putative xenobiotic-transporting ATPase [Rosa chinensis]|uniref:Putative xenobiotic-transporting ATPase n=1 Tax=Rosa chinensis TaxID=74649 RepID=A0A2P6RZT3_ROSCH|nr:putative xenobiotic-transporting ATPase [Rosa chinensis]
MDSSLSEPLLAKTKLDQASFLSKLTLSWVNPLLKLGSSRALDLEDIPSLVSEDEANVAYQKFSNALESLSREKSSSSMSRNLVILRAMARVYMKENVHWFFDSRRSGMRMRSALMVAVYQKQLKLSSLGRRKHSAGEIVNYIAVDAYRMGEFLWWFHSTWSLSLQLLLSIVVLYVVAGVGAPPGLVPLIMFGLLNVPFAKVLQKCQSEFMVAQDERLRATSEQHENH